MAPTASWRSFLGIAKEVTRGTAVAPTDYIKANDFKPKLVPTILLDEGWQGSAVESYGSQQGKAISEISISAPVYADTFGWLLKGVLGDETATGTAPTSHAFSVLNSGDQQPPSLTFTDYDGIQAYAWPGVQLAEVKLTIDPDGNVTYSSSGMGYPSATASTPTQSFSSVLPMQGWRFTVTINGVAAAVQKLDVTIARPVNKKLTLSGTQGPYAVFSGKVSCKITGSVLLETNAPRTAFAADTQGVFTVTGTRGTGATTETLTVTCTTTAYEAIELDRSGDWVDYSVNLVAHANSTDAGASGGKSPVKVTLVNSRSTVY